MIDFTVQSQVISFSAVAVFALAYFVLDLIIVVRIRHHGVSFGWVLFFILSWIVLIASLAFSLMMLIDKFGIFGLAAETDGADVIITFGGRRLIPIPFIAPFAETLFGYPVASALMYSVFVLSLLAVVLLPVKWKRRDDYLSPVLPGEGEGYFSVSENAAREVNSAFENYSGDEEDFTDLSSEFDVGSFNESADDFVADTSDEDGFISESEREMPAPIPDCSKPAVNFLGDAPEKAEDKSCVLDDGPIASVCAPEAASAAESDLNKSNVVDEERAAGASADADGIKKLEKAESDINMSDTEPGKNLRARRSVVTSRAMEIFSEYLEGKDEQEKKKLEASIDKITIDRKND